MLTIARIPNLLYLKYSEKFPKSNIPIKVSEPGQVGLKIDESRDKVLLGAAQVVPGWELGLLGGCQGERRQIMMHQDMAFGELGVFRAVPPRSALVLDVDILKVEN